MTDPCIVSPLPRVCRNPLELRPGMTVRITSLWANGTRRDMTLRPDFVPAMLAIPVEQGRVTILADAPQSRPELVYDPQCRPAVEDRRPPIGSKWYDFHDQAVYTVAEHHPDNQEDWRFEGSAVWFGGSFPSYLRPHKTCPRCSESPCAYSCPAGGWKRYVSETTAAATARAERTIAKLKDDAFCRRQTDLRDKLGIATAKNLDLADERKARLEEARAAQRPFRWVVR